MKMGDVAEIKHLIMCGTSGKIREQFCCPKANRSLKFYREAVPAVLQMMRFVLQKMTIVIHSALGTDLL